MAGTGITGRIGKFGIWTIRFFQLAFALILTGVFAWFHRQLNKGGVGSLNQVSVPLAFSAAAIVFTIISIVTVCFMRGRLQLVAALLDLVLFAGYLASTILFRNNYHIRCSRNPLPQFLINVRQSSGQFRTDGDTRNCTLVRLAAALLVLQTILFFISMLISFYLSRNNNHRTGEPVVVGEKRGGRFGRSRHTSAV